MNKEKQIKQITKDICLVKQNCNDVCNPEDCCQALKYAEKAYEQGYSKQRLPFYPGDKVFAKIGNNVRECVIRVSGLFYDEKYTEPLYAVSYTADVDGVPVRMKWYSTSLKDKPYKTYEEAVRGADNEQREAD